MPIQAVLQVVGYKNSGKTTLMCELIRQLGSDGFTVGTVKHDRHRLELDQEGKDSWQHREAGAEVVAVVSEQANRTFLVEERALALDELLRRLPSVDVVLVEGFKLEKYPKLVLIREREQLPLLEMVTGAILVVTWLPVEEVRPYAKDVQVLSIHDKEQVLRAAAAAVACQLGRS
ncbi:molybdopterin-guanine dinucleotide biosynthesis protein B [Paenibacillus puerhi]|uniref:molybdopterin-guanine dinucleotide biosynthesis protein B n=1 Tax=Paenibacillus puerhi TaxID=2692622 RepID=UPI00135B64E8|nr:molybdopterin-guanine dinucleotide biosynthesis protein B [Paenibacillus puerhi]